MPHFENMVLYYRSSCPFCHYVMSFIDQHDITIELRDISDPTLREELIHIGGKSQVPCLMIDGNPLYESQDIVSYLADRL